MVGFIKNPEDHNYSIQQWAKNIGDNFDAAKLVACAKSAGAVEIIWYDKWIDGLVFHKTRTTSFRTSRDFLAGIAPECKRAELKLIIYTNIFYDDNPEFTRWACTDQRGDPIVFSSSWPARLLSMYSPFREKVLEQTRELLVDYNVDGLWLDVPNFPTISYDRWTRSAFQAYCGKSMEAASPLERTRFAVDSTVQWTQAVASYARRLKPSAVVTYNGAYEPVGAGPRLAIGMAEAVDYFSAELHTNFGQLRRVPVLSQFDKPAEGGYLISNDWFSPLGSGPLKTMKSEDQIDRVAATVFGGGMNLYGAIALSHGGETDKSSIELLDMLGDWLEKRRPYLKSSTNFCDVGIVLGTADRNDIVWPGGQQNHEQPITDLEVSLRKFGYLPCRLLNCAGQQRWDQIPAGIRFLILPDRVSLTLDDRDKVVRFVQQGGTILAFARGAGLGKSGDVPEIADIFAVDNYHYLGPAQSWITFNWGNQPITLNSPVLFVQPQSAQTVLWANAGVDGALPLITVNRVGKGKAYLVVVPESALTPHQKILEHLWHFAIGEPVWKSEDAARYVVRIRSQKGRSVLHIIDNFSSQGDTVERYHPKYTRLDLNSALISFNRATIVPDNRTVQVETEANWKSLPLFPNPELTVLLD